MSGAKLPLRNAVALGLIQGPAELLPISSSSHTTLIPWLLRWRSASLENEPRRSLEVALHAGTAAALIVGGRGRMRFYRLSWPLVLLASAPPAIAGFMLEGFIDRRLSSPRPIAIGLLAGAAGMAAADVAAQENRRVQDAGALDGLLLGAAQVLALAPGISRNGATLAVARARGFTQADADMLSWQSGLPVIAGAAALKLYRGRRRATPAGTGRIVLAGAGAAFVSTLAAARLLARGRARAIPSPSGAGEPLARTRALAPYAAYRLALAVVVMRRLRHDRSRRPPPAARAAGDRRPSA